MSSQPSITCHSLSSEHSSRRSCEIDSVNKQPFHRCYFQSTRSISDMNKKQQRHRQQHGVENIRSRTHKMFSCRRKTTSKIWFYDTLHTHTKCVFYFYFHERCERTKVRERESEYKRKKIISQYKLLRRSFISYERLRFICALFSMFGVAAAVTVCVRLRVSVFMNFVMIAWVETIERPFGMIWNFLQKFKCIFAYNLDNKGINYYMDKARFQASKRMSEWKREKKEHAEKSSSIYKQTHLNAHTDTHPPTTTERIRKNRFKCFEWEKFLCTTDCNVIGLWFD